MKLRALRTLCKDPEWLQFAFQNFEMISQSQPEIGKHASKHYSGTDEHSMRKWSAIGGSLARKCSSRASHPSALAVSSSRVRIPEIQACLFCFRTETLRKKTDFQSVATATSCRFTNSLKLRWTIQVQAKQCRDTTMKRGKNLITYRLWHPPKRCQNLDAAKHFRSFGSTQDEYCDAHLLYPKNSYEES